MKIKIVSSAQPGFWYRDQINKTFDTIEGMTDEEGSVYVNIVTDLGAERLPVRQGDFIIIEDEPEPEKPVRLVYVACSYRTDDPVERELHIKAAQHIGYKLAKDGFYPVMPTVNTAYFDRIGDDRFWLSSTMELMRRCDVVYVVEGSHESKGVQAEIKEARKLGIPIYIHLEDLIEVEGVTSEKV